MQSLASQESSVGRALPGLTLWGSSGTTDPGFKYPPMLALRYVEENSSAETVTQNGNIGHGPSFRKGGSFMANFMES